MAKQTKPPTIYDNMDFPDYVFREYPKVLYAPDDSSLGYKTAEVESPSDERALGKGWFSSPREALMAKAVTTTL